MAPALPNEFDDLLNLTTEWALPSFQERYAKRASSTQEELIKLYDTLLPHMPNIMAYLDKYNCGVAPHQKVEQLFWLALTFMDVSPAVELFGQPTVPHGFDFERATFICFR